MKTVWSQRNLTVIFCLIYGHNTPKWQFHSLFNHYFECLYQYFLLQMCLSEGPSVTFLVGPSVTKSNESYGIPCGLLKISLAPFCRATFQILSQEKLRFWDRTIQSNFNFIKGTVKNKFIFWSVRYGHINGLLNETLCVFCQNSLWRLRMG